MRKKTQAKKKSHGQQKTTGRETPVRRKKTVRFQASDGAASAQMPGSLELWLLLPQGRPIDVPKNGDGS